MVPRGAMLPTNVSCAPPCFFCKAIVQLIGVGGASELPRRYPLGKSCLPPRMLNLDSPNILWNILTFWDWTQPTQQPFCRSTHTKFQKCPQIQQGWGTQVYMKQLGKVLDLEFNVIKMWVIQNSLLPTWIRWCCWYYESVSRLDMVTGWMRMNKLRLNIRLWYSFFVLVMKLREFILDAVVYPLKEQVCSAGILLDPDPHVDTQISSVAHITFLHSFN